MGNKHQAPTRRCFECEGNLRGSASLEVAARMYEAAALQNTSERYFHMWQRLVILTSTNNARSCVLSVTRFCSLTPSCFRTPTQKPTTCTPSRSTNTLQKPLNTRKKERNSRNVRQIHFVWFNTCADRIDMHLFVV